MQGQSWQTCPKVAFRWDDREVYCVSQYSCCAVCLVIYLTLLWAHSSTAFRWDDRERDCFVRRLSYCLLGDASIFMGVLNSNPRFQHLAWRLPSKLPVPCARNSRVYRLFCTNPKKSGASIISECIGTAHEPHTNALV